MKLYAIIEVNDDMYDEFKEWYIMGDDLEIRYVEDNVYKHYETITYEMLELKPLPQKDFIEEAESYQMEEEYKAYVRGWNDCVDELRGEEEC